MPAPLIPGAILIGYVDVAKSVGTQKGAIRLRIRGRYHPTLTSPIVDLDQSVGSWTANMEETLEVGGSLALVGNELWNIVGKILRKDLRNLRESCLSNDSGQSR